MDKRNQQERPESYPKPTKTDLQMQNQDEFIEERPQQDQQEHTSTTSREQERGNSDSRNNTLGNP